MFLSPKIDDVPKPPPLPKYDPNEDAPKWNYSRLFWNVPVDKGTKPWTRVGTQPESSSDPDWRGIIRDNVNPLPMPEPYKFGQPNSTRYMWFDTPDYADPFKKLVFSARIFLLSTATFACGVGIMRGLTPNWKNHLYLTKKFIVPGFLSGMAGSTSVLAVSNLRGKKDDYINYIVGGTVAGLVFGRKTYGAAMRSVVACTVAAIYIKWNAEVNGYLLPRFNFRHHNYDMSGMSADNGITSGDLRLGFKAEDPGRDVRNFDA